MQKITVTIAHSKGPQLLNGYLFTITRDGVEWPLVVCRNKYDRWECSDFASGYSVDNLLRTPMNSTRKTVMEAAQATLTQDCNWFDMQRFSKDLPVLNGAATTQEVAA